MVIRMPQPPLKMSQRILVRHQINKSRPAIGVELVNLRTGQRRSLFPNSAMVSVGKGVFGVKFQMIDFPFGKRIDKRQERLHRRHLVATDVEHHAAHRKIRPIRNLARR